MSEHHSFGDPVWDVAGLAIFEATFALYAQAKFNYGPVEVGAVFVVCVGDDRLSSRRGRLPCRKN